MSTKQAGEVRLLDNALIAKISNADFNRRLNKDKVAKIRRAAEEGIYMPAIIVHKENGKLIIIDGQHRFEARKEKEFPLFVHIIDADKNVAISNFLALNSEGDRVALEHRLRVDPRKFATWVRKVSKQYNMRFTVPYTLMKGIKHVHQAISSSEFSNEEYALAEKILELWALDPRWTAPKECYAKPGVMAAVGYLCAQKQKAGKPIEPLIQNLKEFDYRNGGDISKIAHAGFVSRKVLEQYFIDKLFLKS